MRINYQVVIYSQFKLYKKAKNQPKSLYIL